MKFLANENFPVPSIKILRADGIFVKSIIQETPGIDDEKVLDIASKEELIILTFDRDYGELVFRKKLSSPQGLIYFRLRPSNPEEPAQMLLSLIDRGDVELAKKFTIVEHGRIRQKKLT